MDNPTKFLNLKWYWCISCRKWHRKGSGIYILHKAYADLARQADKLNVGF